MRKKPIFAIFLTVFIDLLSFGLTIPDIQLRAKYLGAHGIVLGAALASFSFAQLLTAPFLGRLSDRVGRRPVLVITTTLAVLSYVVYSQAHVLWILFVARVLSGIAGANLGVAYAYVADVTKPEERAKGLGMIGAAFGLGFILGPGLGVLLVRWGNGKPTLLGFVAAGLAFVNWLYVYFYLPEPQKHEQTAHRKKGLVENYSHAFSSPGLAILLLMFFAYNLGFTNLETTFFQLLAVKGWIYHLSMLDAEKVGGIILICVGVVSAVMQGGIVRKLIPIFGEVSLLRTAYIIQSPTLALVPFLPLWGPQLTVVVLLGIGGGLAQPSLSSLISRKAPRDMQGGIFGVTQSLGAMARVIGPLLSNTLFPIRPWLPYVVGGAIILGPAVASWWVSMPDNEEHD